MNTITIKNGKGKSVTYTLPEVPVDFINGKRALAVLKRYIRAHHEDEKACSAAVRKLERIFSAPRLDYLKFEISYTNSRVNGWTPHAELWAGQRGYAWWYLKATAGGAGYDKSSAAIASALWDKADLRAAWQRLAIENFARLNKAGLYGFHAYGFADKSDEFLPRFHFSGAGLSTLQRFLDALGWKKAAWVDGRNFDYCDYYKPVKKH